MPPQRRMLYTGSPECAGHAGFVKIAAQMRTSHASLHLSYGIPIQLHYRNSIFCKYNNFDENVENGGTRPKGNKQTNDRQDRG